MTQAFSEYVLYEPILRILTARHFSVRCECVCPGIEQPKVGDKKRLDFYAVNSNAEFAMEVKWSTRRALDIRRDLEKLIAFRRTNPAAHSFLCVFGRKSHISDLDLSSRSIRESGTAIYAEFRRTKYGCRIYEIQDGS